MNAELGGPLAWDDVMRRIARFLVPRVADWYVLITNRPSGGATLASFGHQNVERQRLLAAIMQQASDPNWPNGTLLDDAASLSRTAWLPTLEGLTPSVLDRLCGWPAEQMRALGTGSAACIPLSLNGRTLGAVLLVRERAGGYEQQYFELAVDSSRQLAVSVDDACQYQMLTEQYRRIEDLLDVAAHELRTPVSTISCYAQLVLRQMQATHPPDDRALESAFTLIERQSHRLGDLITCLLDRAQLRADKVHLHCERADLRQLVTDVVRLVQAADLNHSVSVYAPDSVHAVVDVVRMQQVLLNLLDNACKFSPPDSGVQLTVTMRTPGITRVTVRDHGPGVPPDERERIFEPYFQVNSGVGNTGLGLGLHVSRKIVELHGGRLLAEFPPDGGSQFTIELRAHTSCGDMVAARGAPDRLAGVGY